MDMKSNLDITVQVSSSTCQKKKKKMVTMATNLCFWSIGCQLVIAYEMNEHRKSGLYTYVLDGALTENQGHAPANAIIDVLPISSNATSTTITSTS